MLGRLLSVSLLAVAWSSASRFQGPTSRSTPSGDSSCVAALDSLQALFRHDYPGYRDKVRGHEKQLAALNDSVRAVARTSDEHQICIPALQRWARFFRDPHIAGPWQASPPAAQATGAGTGQQTEARNDDPNRPSVEFLDDCTAAIRLPSFDAMYKAAVDSLIAEHRARLGAIPLLIIDVRGNGGGYTGTYAAVSPFVYTGPIRTRGVDVWASPANIAHYRELSRAAFLSDAERRLMRSFLSRAANQVNRFVQLEPDTIIRRDSVFPMPRRVAVLADSACASSCEDFLLEVGQSSKVTLMGTHSAGVHDYGEVRGVWLPGWRRVVLPTNRTRGPRIDNLGIAPEIQIPPDSDAFAIARRYLESR